VIFLALVVVPKTDLPFEGKANLSLFFLIVLALIVPIILLPDKTCSFSD